MLNAEPLLYSLGLPVTALISGECSVVPYHLSYAKSLASVYLQPIDRLFS
jgi:hypothetical protein